jgi:predicted nucleic acid-binding Zn ribbon protein
MLVAIEKNCIACNKTIRGRSDKKFCNDSCRNSYNNQNRSNAPNLVKKINAVLVKNRNLLLEITGDNSQKKITREQLSLRGFLFNYYTHSYTNKRGNTYYFCYDHGWLDVNDSILVVKSSIGI